VRDQAAQVSQGSPTGGGLGRERIHLSFKDQDQSERSAGRRRGMRRRVLTAYLYFGLEGDAAVAGVGDLEMALESILRHLRNVQKLERRGLWQNNYLLFIIYYLLQYCGRVWYSIAKADIYHSHYVADGVRKLALVHYFRNLGLYFFQRDLIEGGPLYLERHVRQGKSFDDHSKEEKCGSDWPQACATRIESRFLVVQRTVQHFLIFFSFLP
jgi:hypothetical protein